MTAKTVTPQGISALLRKAGFTRSEKGGAGYWDYYGKTDRIYYTPGISFGRAAGGFRVYLATWRRWVSVGVREPGT